MTVEGIILAAGLSKRAGAFKPEWSLDGRPLICRTIDNMSDFCSRIILVGGYKIERLAELTRDYTNIYMVFNKDYERGMFSSVKEGIRQLQGDRFFLIPGDCPFVTKGVYRKLQQTMGDIVIPTFQGRKGHPVLIKTALAEEILHEPDDSNLGNFIRRKGFKTAAVNDNGILLDIDTRQDYEKITKIKCPGG